MGLMDGDDYKANPDQDDRSTELLPEGLYKVSLDSAEHVISSKNTEGWKLTYRVTEGPFANVMISDPIWISNEDFTRRRKRRFMKKLGMITEEIVDGEKQYAAVEGVTDFTDVLGATGIVVKVVHEVYTKKNGSEGKSAKLEAMGIYRFDDPEIDEFMGRTKSPKPPKGGQPATNGKPQTKPATSAPAKPKAAKKVAEEDYDAIM